MSKYTKSFKLQIVKDYESSHLGSSSFSKQYGVSKSTLENWVRDYRFYGSTCFDKRLQSYSLEFKLKVLKHMEAHGLSLPRTANLFNIPAPSTIFTWQRLYRLGSEPALLSSKLGSEREVVGLIAKGDSNKNIARELNISDRTVKTHLSIIFHKLKVNDRLQLAPLIRRQLETELHA